MESVIFMRKQLCNVPIARYTINTIYGGNYFAKKIKLIFIA